MFRVTRIYKRNRANKLAKRELLKCSLIALLIGAIGTGGSFAWFKSNAEVKSNLKIETGNINVSVEDRLGNNIKTGAINIQELHPLSNGSSKISGKSEFKIKNTGSLNQVVNLAFESSDNNPELLKNFNCVFTFRKKDSVEGDLQKINMKDLINKDNQKKLIPKDIHGNPITLKKDEKIDCTFEINLNSEIDRKYSGKSVNFNLIVDANQVNKK